jgi:V8-like Glu-specific endopeptidase
MKWLPLLLLSFSAFAGYYGKDDREESRSSSVPAYLRELSLSVPAIVENKMLIPAGENFLPKGLSMKEMNFCPGVRFWGQEYLAHCSSSLIGEDLILTAGHCVDDEDFKKWCREHSIVFDYAVGAGDKKIEKKNVYACKEVLYRKYEGAFDEDLALIRLVKKVEDRTPIRVSSEVVSVGEKLSMIGYPLGIPQKVVDDGSITEIGPSKYSFRHKVDTFSSNSGGPMFNARGEQVGVLVRGTGPNQSDVPGKKCFDWGEDKDADFAEANTLLHLKFPQ